ncbi:unnamed protein product [Coregonus sp. 'balchen']|nr:unnamed protein product [Coregonus sp. 'balchen']
MSDNGVLPVEVDPAAAFLAQQESEIAVIENNDEGFGALDGSVELLQQPPVTDSPAAVENHAGFAEASAATVNGDMFELKAKKELEDWHVHQNEQMEKNKANNRASEEAFLSEADGDSPGTEWERVARLCDFNPKTNKTAKDVSRMRSVLIALKQTPLVR